MMMTTTLAGIICIAVIEVAGFICVAILAASGHEGNIPAVIMMMGTAGAMIPNLLETRATKKIASEAKETAGEALKESQVTTKKVEEGVTKLSNENQQMAKSATEAAASVANESAKAIVSATERVADHVAKTASSTLAEVIRLMANK